MSSPSSKLNGHGGGGTRSSSVCSAANLVGVRVRVRVRVRIRVRVRDGVRVRVGARVRVLVCSAANHGC